MKIFGKLFVLLLVALVATQAIGALARTDRQAPPAIPSAADMPAMRLVHAQAFALEVPYRHDWCAERPEVREGHLVVLATAPDLLVRRQTAEPVVHCGAVPVERVNDGGESGHLVAFVPVRDLAGEAFFFAAPELPERVDAAWSRAERDGYLARGGRAPDDITLQAALAEGGEALFLRDRVELGRVAARLVRAYAPEDAHIADRLERSGQR